MTQISGVTTYTLDGVPFAVNAEITYNVVTAKREYIPNWSGQTYFGEAPQLAFIKAKLIDTGLSKAQFMAMSGVTNSVQCANGYTVVLTNAECFEVGDVSVAPDSSTFEVTFYSAIVDEIPATA
jgi:hypothetical protein